MELEHGGSKAEEDGVYAYDDILAARGISTSVRHVERKESTYIPIDGKNWPMPPNTINTPTPKFTIRLYQLSANSQPLHKTPRQESYEKSQNEKSVLQSSVFPVSSSASPRSSCRCVPAVIVILHSGSADDDDLACGGALDMILEEAEAIDRLETRAVRCSCEP